MIPRKRSAGRTVPARLAVGAALAVAALVACWGIADAAGLGFDFELGVGNGDGSAADVASADA